MKFGFCHLTFSTIFIKHLSSITHQPFHQILFYLLLVLLPTQLGLHFWFDFSLVRGIRIDYLSPTINLTDVLIVGICVGWIWEWIVTRKQKTEDGELKRGRRTENRKCLPSAFRLLFSISLIFFILSNILLSVSPSLALYKWIKVLEFVFIVFYVYKNNSSSFVYSFIGLLGFSIIYSSFIAIGQFVNQGSIGGMLYWLGERTFSSETPGIAQIVLNGQLFLRPYATFPHPNALAGYTLVVLTLLAEQGRTLNPIINRVGPYAIALGLITILLSFSRSVWVIGLGVIFFMFLKKIKIDSVITTFITSVFIGLLLVRLSLGVGGGYPLFSPNEESFLVREQLMQASIDMIQHAPLIGVGLGNFIPALPLYSDIPLRANTLQPVHNIYLLIASETGVIGLVVFVGIILKVMSIEVRRQKTENRKEDRRQKGESKNIFSFSFPFSNSVFRLQSSVLPLALLEILLLGLTDHYFITLQQTQLLFAIIIGLMFIKNNETI